MSHKCDENCACNCATCIAERGYRDTRDERADIEDAPTRPDLPRLQPLAMRIANALAACPEPEAEELWRALRALQRCTPKVRRVIIDLTESNAERP